MIQSNIKRDFINHNENFNVSQSLKRLSFPRRRESRKVFIYYENITLIFVFTNFQMKTLKSNKIFFKK